MKIKIREIKKPELSEFLPLYTDAGWSNYFNNPEMLTHAYQNSLEILGAYDREKLVGIIRVVGDGHSIVYIQDIIVLREYQRRGIGSELIKAILKIYKDVYQKVLLTDDEPETVSFYKSLGFTTDSDMGCIAFIHLNL